MGCPAVGVSVNAVRVAGFITDRAVGAFSRQQRGTWCEAVWRDALTLDAMGLSLDSPRRQPLPVAERWSWQMPWTPMA